MKALHLKKYFKAFISFGMSLLLQLPFFTYAADSKALDKLMADKVVPFLSAKQIPGIAIAIYYNDQNYYFNYGVANKQKNTPVTKDTIFEVASLTKIFVTTLLAVEINQDKIHLSDPVVRFIPRLLKTSGLPIDNMKVVHLATHTSSFPRQMEQFGVKKNNVIGFLDRLKTWHPQRRIGTQYTYSNIGFGLLGNLVVEAAHESLPNLLNHYITQPLEMTHTYFTVPQDMKGFEAQGYTANHSPAAYYVAPNYLGGGALRSSSADLLKFMKANLGLQVGHVSLQLLSAMQLAQQPYFKVKPKFAMGLGWQRVQRGQELLITKDGANQGYTTFMAFSPSKKIGVVVLINQAESSAPVLGNQIINALLRF